MKLSHGLIYQEIQMQLSYWLSCVYFWARLKMDLHQNMDSKIRDYEFGLPLGLGALAIKEQ